MAAAVRRSPPPTSPKGVVPQGPNSAARNVKASPKKQAKGGLKNTSASQNVTATQRNPTHVIRINVLGIAGIAVDRRKCNDICRKGSHPSPPENMKAVVAVARGSQIHGTTTPSKPLSRSPDHDVIVAGTAVDGDESVTVNGIRHGDDEETQGTDMNNLHRHVAVWTGADHLSLGSLMTFDACLSSSSLDQRNSIASVSSQYVPKSFDLMVALTGDSKAYNKVALPFGVANINISGDECPRGETIVLDLPILSLLQAKPFASNDNGLASYQMIAIRPKKAGADVAPQKRGAFGRFFRKKSDKKSPLIPTIAERSRFTEVYSPDPSGDAILRVQLQVVEKAASKFQREGSLARTEITPGVKPLEQNTKKDDGSLDKDANTSTTQSIEESWFAASAYGSFSEQSVETDDSKTLSADASIISHRTSDSNSLFTEGSRTFPITASRTVDSETVGSRTLDSRTIDSRTIDTTEMKEKERGSIVDDEAESYFEERRGAKSRVDESNDTLNAPIIKVFGREVRFPSCGGVIDDEMTHVTGDFFGKAVPIPVCSGMKPGEFDEETLFPLRQNDSLSTLTMLLPRHTTFGKHTGDKATLQSTLGEDSVSKTSKSTEKGVEMRLHRPSSRTGDNMTTSTKSKSSKASLAYNSPIRVVDSPKGVEKFPEEDQQEEKTSSSLSNMSDRFVQMFRCGATDVSRSDDAIPYKEAGVPALVIPGDASTVGDLTAITHELHIDKQRARRTGSKRYPVACGGNGVCSSTDLVDDAAVLRGFEIQHFSNATKSSLKENYFSEYDDVGFEDPNTLKKTDPGEASLEMSLNANSLELNWANVPVTITEAVSESESEFEGPEWA